MRALSDTSGIGQRCFRSLVLIGVTLSASGASFTASAQGCEPIRFTTPVNLGGAGKAYQPAHEWEFTLAYRHLYSDQFFVGTHQSDASAPLGVSPIIEVHTWLADVAYSVNDRTRVRLSVPLSSGRETRGWGDGQIHDQSVTGIGDISATVESWLLDPRTHDNGNVSLGFAIKAPTANFRSKSLSYNAPTAVPFTADQNIQPGDGGWGVSLSVQAFRKLTERAVVYADGSYLANPRAYGAEVAPGAGIFWAVPDVYSARAGAVVAIIPRLLSVSLGGRLDGIPVHDLLGSGDKDSYKRSAYIVYADPGLSVSQGHSTVTLSVPIRMSLNRLKSVAEQQTGGLNAGGFAKSLVFLSYTYRR